MNQTRKIKITELNPHVICVLCGGYYINATTITECLHSFCRTCITRYLETSKYCPVCDVMVHKTRPLEYIRSDKTLQDLVYKLVPGLYKTEMKRRREYYSINDSSGVPQPPSEDRGDEFYDRIIYTEDEKISLSLELCAEGIPFKTPSSVHGHSGPGNIRIKDVRYLQCPAAFSVGNIKKFIRMKFDLKQKYEIDVFHTAEPLLDYYTLMDIAYIYTWTRRAPLRLYYTVYETKGRQTQPVITSQAQTNPTSDTSIVVMETDNTTREKSTDSEKENQDSNTTSAGKRKFPDGPGDISPDIEFEKTRPLFSEVKRKDGVPRKRAKKHVVYDSSVLEAMSESEEQLAKLTLGGEEGLKANAKARNDCGGKTVNGNTKSNDEVTSAGLSNKDVTTNVETSEEKPVDQKNAAETRLGEIVLSQFTPLNTSSDKTKECVYEFKSDQQVKPETPKCKSKPRKKKELNNPGKTSDIPQPSLDTSLVKSGKHPGITTSKVSNSPKKKSADANTGDDKKTTATGKKRGRPPVNKEVKLPSEPGIVGPDGKVAVQKVKRKYVRKADKIAKAVKDSAIQENGKISDEVNSKVIDTSTDKQDSADKNDSKPTKAKPEIEKVNTDVSNAANIGANNAAMSDTVTDKQRETQSDSNESKAEKDCNKEPKSQSVETVPKPATPLYGQTPKVMEENQGLPVSPNPDCAESNVITNGANGAKCQPDVEAKDTSVKSVNNSIDKSKCANSGGPVNYGMANSLGFNSVGIKSIGLPTNGSNSVSVSHVSVVGYPGYSNSDISGNTNGFNRSVLPTNMTSYSDVMSPLSPLSPGGVCVMGGYPRLSDPHCHSGQVTNGYSGLEQNSDQPLDLTNNGHREEYMKGKIFKTKLLKKPYSKDNMPAQKDKTNSQINNGLLPGSWI